jgi:hypothetical protein
MSLRGRHDSAFRCAVSHMDDEMGSRCMWIGEKSLEMIRLARQQVLGTRLHLHAVQILSKNPKNIFPVLLYHTT